MTSSFEKVKNAAAAAVPGAGSFFQNAQPGPAEIIAESAGVKAKTSLSANTSQYLTSNYGQPWPGDGQHALNVGGMPVIDPFGFEKQQTFNREKQTERRVHADGAGVFGTFEVTHDVSHLTKAGFLSQVGKSTPLFARFSTVTYEKGYPDLARNPRGMALKFYTEDGNYDLVGLNYPIFFNSDPAIGPDVIRSQSRNPHTGLLDYDACLDLLANVPESMHAGTMFFSDSSTPDGFKHHGYGCHTFTWVNAEGKRTYIKYTMLRKGGQKFLTMEEAMQRAGWRPDYSKEELFSQVQKGGEDAPIWDVYVQTMEVADSAKYDFTFDVTKVWPRGQFPLQPVGRIVLNKLPEDQHRDVELAAFSPGSFVPGIESSPDPLLQYRIWFYRDAQYWRFGSGNIHQVPVNCPFMAQQHAPISKAGNMRVDKDGVDVRAYHPNSYDKPRFSLQHAEQPFSLGDAVVSRRGRFRSEGTDETYDQVRELYSRVMSTEQQTSLHKNTAWWMSQPLVQDTTRIKYLAQLLAISRAYYEGVLQQLEPTVKKSLDLDQVEALAPKAATVNKVPEGMRDGLSPLVGLDISASA